MLTRTRRRIAGFTMLEVLISMVIIAFGLLGVAGLQAFALKNNQSASFRSTAAALAGDMVDRIKSNIGGAIDGNYNAPSTSSYSTPDLNCTTSAGCSTAALALNDLSEWSQRVAATLPGGVGIVCLDSTPNDGDIPTAPLCDGKLETNYVVKIWWTDDRTASGVVARPQRFSTGFNQ